MKCARCDVLRHDEIAENFRVVGQILRYAQKHVEGSACLSQTVFLSNAKDLPDFSEWIRVWTGCAALILGPLFATLGKTLRREFRL